MCEKRSPPASRIAAAQELLNRGYGKPLQQSEVTVTRQTLELTDEEIARRLADLGIERKAEVVELRTALPN